jgi:hypothetical protein
MQTLGKGRNFHWMRTEAKSEAQIKVQFGECPSALRALCSNHRRRKCLSQIDPKSYWPRNIGRPSPADGIRESGTAQQFCKVRNRLAPMPEISAKSALVNSCGQSVAGRSGAAAREKQAGPAGRHFDDDAFSRLGHSDYLFRSKGPMVDAALEKYTRSARASLLWMARAAGGDGRGSLAGPALGDPGRGREATPVAMVTPWWRPQSCLRLGV